MIKLTGLDCNFSTLVYAVWFGELYTLLLGHSMARQFHQLGGPGPDMQNAVNLKTRFVREFLVMFIFYF